MIKKHFNILRFQKVFGYVERFVPACDGQLTAQGLGYIFGNSEPSRRALAYRGQAGSYFPLRWDLNWVVGFNCAGRRDRQGVVLLLRPTLPDGRGSVL